MTITPIRDSNVGNNYQAEPRKDSKNKSTTDLQVLNNLKVLTLTSNHTSTNSWLNNKDKFNPANNSTLSLHIAAYENTVQPQKGVEDVPEKLKSKKKPLSTIKKDIFLQKYPGIEFPRQQEGNEGVTPEIEQFRASQILLNPNAVPPQERPQPQILDAFDVDESDIGNQGYIGFETLLSDDEEDEQSRNPTCKELCCMPVRLLNGVDPEVEIANLEKAFSFNANDSAGIVIEKHENYIAKLKAKDKRLKPVSPLDLISNNCKCGRKCNAVLSIKEICQLRTMWPIFYHDRISCQFYITKTLMVDKCFMPNMKGNDICIDFFCALNIFPKERALRFVQLITDGVDSPIHPNTGRRFHRETTIEKLARLAIYINENFEENPAKNSYLPSSRITKSTAAGEALKIPVKKRRKQNFSRLFKALAVETHFVSGNSLTKCNICTDYSFKLRKTSLSEEEKARIRLEWENHKAKISTFVLLSGEFGNTTTVGFFSPGGCFDNTTNAILSQILYTLTTLPHIPPTIFIQIDNFPGNKSYLFFAVFGYLLLRQTTIKEFYVSFMMPGHTHCDVDARFGNFSTYLNSKECGSPQELMSSFLECIPGEAKMKQSIYNFKEVLTPQCHNYGTVKSMYDFHIYLDEKNVPMVENARYELSERVLCGSRQKEDSFVAKIFKQPPPLDLQFQLVMPKMDGIDKMIPHITKWEKVITATAKNELLNLREEIHSNVGTPFLTWLQTTQEKAVTTESSHALEPEIVSLEESTTSENLPQTEEPVPIILASSPTTIEEQSQTSAETPQTVVGEPVPNNLRRSSRLAAPILSNSSRKRKNTRNNE
uniref:Transposase n=1 Tax=Panagrolaimus davidi TaxID=227884 RepID=A0A914P309_9BILA